MSNFVGKLMVSGSLLTLLLSAGSAHAHDPGKAVVKLQKSPRAVFARQTSRIRTARTLRRVKQQVTRQFPKQIVPIVNKRIQPFHSIKASDVRVIGVEPQWKTVQKRSCFGAGPKKVYRRVDQCKVRFAVPNASIINSSALVERKPGVLFNLWKPIPSKVSYGSLPRGVSLPR